MGENGNWPRRVIRRSPLGAGRLVPDFGTVDDADQMDTLLTTGEFDPVGGYFKCFHGKRLIDRGEIKRLKRWGQ